MRLIDADELKTTIYEWRYHGFYDKLIEVINNAPTVELFCPNCGADMRGENNDKETTV